MTKQELLTIFKTLMVVLIVLISIFLGLYVHTFGWGFSSQASDWGNFGSYLNGSLGTSLAGLTTIILILTLVLQIRQFDNTKEVVILTQKQVEMATKTAELGRFENTFFHLLTSYSNMVEGFSYDNDKGRKAFTSLHHAVFGYFNAIHPILSKKTIAEYFKENETELDMLRKATPKTGLPNTEFRKALRSFQSLWVLREIFFANRQLASLPLSIVDLLLKHKTMIDYQYYLSIFTAQVSITERRLLIFTFSCFKSADASNAAAEESFLELIPLADDRKLFEASTKYFTEIGKNQEILMEFDAL